MGAGTPGTGPPGPRRNDMPGTKTEVHVRVLYPSAFSAVGIDADGKDEVKVNEEQAEWLIAAGHAELVEKPVPKKAST